eukprot:3937176-Rhodomonas_salina.1
MHNTPAAITIKIATLVGYHQGCSSTEPSVTIISWLFLLLIPRDNVPRSIRLFWLHCRPEPDWLNTGLPFCRDGDLASRTGTAEFSLHIRASILPPDATEFSRENSYGGNLGMGFAVVLVNGTGPCTTVWELRTICDTTLTEANSFVLVPGTVLVLLSTAIPILDQDNCRSVATVLHTSPETRKRAQSDSPVVIFRDFVLTDEDMCAVLAVGVIFATCSEVSTHPPQGADYESPLHTTHRESQTCPVHFDFSSGVVA